MTTVASLGVHILDVLGRPVTRIPDGQNIDLLEEIRFTVAGTAAGTAVDLAKLGVKVIAMGALGEDYIGDTVVGIMQHYGIDTDCLVRKKAVQTSATMLPIRPNGERPALHVIGANGEFSLDDICWDRLKQVDFAHLGGFYLLPKLDGEPAGQIARFCREHGVRTTMDILGIPREDMLSVVAPSLPYLDYFMPSLDEARMICGLRDWRDVCKFFLNQGARACVFKMGANGSVYADQNGVILRMPAFKVRVVDTTGCGDAYCAGFIAGLGMGWDIEQSMRLATAASALVATALGSDAGIVNLEQTIEFMNTAETLPMTE
ncbi:MAG: sugar kinase [Anaerolineae bacterium]|nr:sugar kinase [Thermoflexales bacterium]MDW8395175.1 sugar kinase [Anaerolineae bacterium]